MHDANFKGILRQKAAIPLVLFFLVITLAFHAVGAISAGSIEQRYERQIT